MVGESRAESEERPYHSKLEYAIFALGGDDESWEKLISMGLKSKSEEDLYSMLEDDPNFAEIVKICVRCLDPNHEIDTKEATFLEHWGVFTRQLLGVIGELGRERQKKKLGSSPI